MGVGEGGNLGSRGKVSIGICKIILLDGLCWPDNVAPTGVEVCPARNTHCWYPLCATGIVIERRLYYGPVRRKDKGVH